MCPSVCFPYSSSSKHFILICSMCTKTRLTPALYIACFFLQLYYESFPLKNTMAVKAASLLFFVTMVPRIAKSIALENNSCNHVTTPMKFHHNHSYLIYAIMIYSYFRFTLHHDQKITCFNPHHDHLDKTADYVADDTCIQIITHSILSEQLKLSLT